MENSKEHNKIPKEIFDPVRENKKKFADLFGEKIEEVFPSAVKDGEVDFKALLAELGEYVDSNERYELTWAGKAEAKRIANTDIVAKTLKYIPEDSKDADTTENLYIEGDNLEVLKLLRNSYYNKIKMIYIDPPYNTGNDFVYKDKFSITATENAQEEGDMDEKGERYIVNQKSSSKYHSTWLTMMYPRLKAAKDLLTNDGVLFISVDDNEVDNVKNICNELFGEDNFVANIVRVAKTTSFRGNYFAPSKDYILCYAKNIISLQRFSDDVDESQYKKIETEGDRVGEKYRDDIAFYLSTLETRPNQRYYIECPDGQKVIPPGRTFPPEKPKEGDGVWRWNYNSFQEKKDLIVFKKTNRSPLIDEDGNQANWNIYTKSYLSEKLENGNIPRDFFEGFLNRSGSAELKKLDIPFSFPKPVDLIARLVKIIQTEKDAIILDFFSGSATTAHAVMKQNAEDEGRRKFIMVQLPEQCDEKSDAFKEGYKTICEIGKERIRRAGDKIKEENKDKEGIENLDIGFKVFKVEDTNIRWFSEAIKTDKITLDESMMSDKDKLDFNPGYTDIDVVYEILLRHRDIPLSATVEHLKAIGERTYMFADAIVVCLDEIITEEMIDSIAAIEPMPTKIIFRDSAFEANISLKENTMLRLQAQIKKQSGLEKKAYRIEFI